MPETVITTPRIATELPPSVDPLGQALQMLQLQGVLYCRAEFSAPWGIALPSLAGVMMLEVVTVGRGWLLLPDRSPQPLSTGSLILIPGGQAHQLCSTPDSPCTPLAEIPIELLGERIEWMRHGGGGKATHIAYCGVRFEPILAQRLLAQLPTVIHLSTDGEDDGWLHNTIRFIAREAQQLRPGHETVITRLADILVIQALRAWIDQASTTELGWIAALRDRQIGQALALIHGQPAQDWRVASLAQAVGMSRSGFAARFSALVGEPALHYLTTLRMQLAHRQLRETNDTIAVIAERVGYHSEVAFHRAFKRVMGVAPGALRQDKT